MQLTPKQIKVLYQIYDGVKNKKLYEQTLGGYAGTGKTTIIKFLVTKYFPNFAVCAYTGKAANVLQKKGVPATTIHSRIYKPVYDGREVYFELTDDPGCEGFIVDEASMVSSEIYYDLKSFGLPIVFVGDHGQLEPVDSDFNLMAEPDYTLEEIHRNAGDIAKFAEHVRKGFAPRGFKCSDGSVRFLSKYSVTDETLLEADQIICAFNKTRVETNNQIRKALDLTETLHLGEKVMCLRNNRANLLFNGMQGVVTAIETGKWGRTYMDFEFAGDIKKDIWYDKRQFGQESYNIKHGKDTPHPFDYAYCITCHKAQGDEWSHVLTIEQKCRNWDHRRWAYTAASRAKTQLSWVLN